MKRSSTEGKRRYKRCATRTERRRAAERDRLAAMVASDERAVLAEMRRLEAAIEAGDESFQKRSGRI